MVFVAVEISLKWSERSVHPAPHPRSRDPAYELQTEATNFVKTPSLNRLHKQQRHAFFFFTFGDDCVLISTNLPGTEALALLHESLFTDKAVE